MCSCWAISTSSCVIAATISGWICPHPLTSGGIMRDRCSITWRDASAVLILESPGKSYWAC